MTLHDDKSGRLICPKTKVDCTYQLCGEFGCAKLPKSARGEVADRLQNYAVCFAADDEGLTLVPESWNAMRADMDAAVALLRADERAPSHEQPINAAGVETPTESCAVGSPERSGGAAPSTTEPKPRGTYIPLTEEEIEDMRPGAAWQDGEVAHGYTSVRKMRVLCDMAINSLLYAQEIDRLRSLPVSATRLSAFPVSISEELAKWLLEFVDKQLVAIAIANRTEVYTAASHRRRDLADRIRMASTDGGGASVVG